MTHQNSTESQIIFLDIDGHVLPLTCLNISSSSLLLRSSSCLRPDSSASRILRWRSANIEKAWIRRSSWNEARIILWNFKKCEGFEDFTFSFTRHMQPPVSFMINLQCICLKVQTISSDKHPTIFLSVSVSYGLKIELNGLIQIKIIHSIEHWRTYVFQNMQVSTKYQLQSNHRELCCSNKVIIDTFAWVVVTNQYLVLKAET